MVEAFYLVSSCAYIQFMSIERSHTPYKFNEQLNKVREQVQRGLSLGFSAFLLIVVYGIIFIKIGKVVLPSSVNLGTKFKHDIWIFVVLCFLNPILEEWFWRLFLPKVNHC
jgi:membrane protease YdiL (CAAX protease family)